MIKNVTVIFDNDAEVTLIGDGDKIAELLRPGNYKGIIFHKDKYYPESAWDIDRLKQILGKKK